MDEFAACLDRDTAKIIAFNLQKIARQQGKAVIAATTHNDLVEDLNPSVLGTQTVWRRNPNTILSRTKPQPNAAYPRNENRTRNNSQTGTNSAASTTAATKSPSPERSSASVQKRGTLRSNRIQLPSTRMLRKTPNSSKNDICKK